MDPNAQSSVYTTEAGLLFMSDLHLRKCIIVRVTVALTSLPRPKHQVVSEKTNLVLPAYLGFQFCQAKKQDDIVLYAIIDTPIRSHSRPQRVTLLKARSDQIRLRVSKNHRYKQTDNYINGTCLSRRLGLTSHSSHFLFDIDLRSRSPAAPLPC